MRCLPHLFTCPPGLSYVSGSSLSLIWWVISWSIFFFCGKLRFYCKKNCVLFIYLFRLGIQKSDVLYVLLSATSFFGNEVADDRQKKTCFTFWWWVLIVHSLRLFVQNVILCFMVSTTASSKSNSIWWGISLRHRFTETCQGQVTVGLSPAHSGRSHTSSLCTGTCISCAHLITAQMGCAEMIIPHLTY